jgi:hypothetical protein
MSLNYSFVRGYLVDLIGIEPMTSSMPWKRAQIHSPAKSKTTWKLMLPSAASIFRNLDGFSTSDLRSNQLRIT